MNPLKIEEICDTDACFDDAWQTARGTGADFFNQLDLF
jgi:hypothetical protein